MAENWRFYKKNVQLFFSRSFTITILALGNDLLSGKLEEVIAIW